MPKRSRQYPRLENGGINTRALQTHCFCAVSAYQANCLFCTRNRPFPALGDNGAASGSEAAINVVPAERLIRVAFPWSR
jgi:hypothetical protein